MTMSEECRSKYLSAVWNLVVGISGLVISGFGIAKLAVKIKELDVEKIHTVSDFIKNVC